jgi:O-antigen/teichoic acid export membrane protein
MVVIAGVATSGIVAGPLGSPSPWPIVAMWIAIGVNVALALGLSLLQGAHRFMHLSAGSLASAGARLLMCVALVAAGFGVVGAMAGIAIASGVGALAVWLALGRWPAPGDSNAPQHGLLLSRDAVVLALSNLSFVAMTQFDYVLARVFLPAEQASQYAAASMLAKSVLWLPVGIVIAMFPMVASEAAALRPSRHLLVRGLWMAALTSGALAAILAIGAGVWVKFFYGPRFEPAAPYLAVLALAYLPMAIALVVDNYQLALHRARFIAAYAAVAVAEVVALALPSASPERLIAVLVGGSFLCLAWAVWIVREQLRAGATQGKVSRS